MRIQKKSKELIKAESKEWHMKFAWLPVRVSVDEVQWLKKVARIKNANIANGKKTYTTEGFTYCDPEELLKSRLAGEAWAQERGYDEDVIKSEDIYEPDIIRKIKKQQALRHKQNVMKHYDYAIKKDKIMRDLELEEKAQVEFKKEIEKQIEDVFKKSMP